MRLLAVVGLAALVTTGCAGSYPRLSFALEQRILRETTLDDLPSGERSPDDAIVRIIRTGRQGGVCSGALIGPRHVLTAEHCMMKAGIDKELTNVKVVPGDVHVELGGDYLPWGRVGVREIHACPGFVGTEETSETDLAHDIAVIILSKPVPTEVPHFAMDFGEPHEDDRFAVVGYGSGEKIRTVALTSDLSPASHGSKDWAMLSLPRHTVEGPLYTSSDAALYVSTPGAPGDSGGPIIDTTTKRIISVISRGRTQKDADKSNDGIGPITAGPRLATCETTIREALAR